MRKAATEGSTSGCGGVKLHQPGKGAGGCLEEAAPRPALSRTVDKGREGGGRGGVPSTGSAERAQRHPSAGVCWSGVERTQEDGFGLVTWPECQRSGVGVA